MNGKFEEYLQKIEEFLEIDDKIITYKWLSKALRVHTNTAKQLLYAYTKSDSNHGKFLVTYIVAGERPDCEGLDVRLVTETELADVKIKFSKVSSVHVYSVQKGTILSGSEIYNAETSYKLTEEEQRFSSIIPEEEITHREIKAKSCSSVQSASGTSKSFGKVGSSVQSSTISDKANSSKHKEQSNKGEENPEPRKTSPRKQSPKKGENSVKEEKTEPRRTSPRKQSPKKKAPPPSVKNRIGALFKKQSAKNSEKPTKKEVHNKNSKETAETDKKVIKTPVSDPTPKSKRKKSKANKDFSVKQRKRIRVASESEESNAESDGDERFPSPEPEPETPAVLESEEEEEIIPATPQERGRKRMRKPVDHTYFDEDGFILTKKEFITESCSDDEVSEPSENKVVEETAQKSEHVEDTQGAKTSVKMTTPKGRKDAKSTGKGGSPEEGKPASDPNAKGPAKKAGRPAKAKPADSSSSKQSSITSFFKKK